MKHLVQLLVISSQQTQMLLMHFNNISYNDTENGFEMQIKSYKDNFRKIGRIQKGVNIFGAQRR